MKKLAAIALPATIAAALQGPAHAAQTTAGFGVTVNLTPICSLGTGPTDIIYNYTSFQTTASAPNYGSSNGSWTIKCTTSLVASLRLDSATGGTLTSFVESLTGQTLSLTLSQATLTGTGANQTFGITASSLPANLSGTCSVATGCQSIYPHTLYVTY